MNWRDARWPAPLADEAFHGLAGEVVRTLEPHTEADPAALLLQFLAAFGNVIDRGPHFQAEADRHALNLFVVLVGETSKARKGTSWAHVFKLVSRCDTNWKDFCIQTGLSSGEGLIHAVRDQTQEESNDDAPPDNGAMDSRLLVMEPEFASPLRMIARDGNTLSPVVRQAWDGGSLQVMTKQCPETATSPHISIIGHITKDELRRDLTRIDAGSGFGNRFLWACVRRSKSLPDGGQLPESDVERLADKLKHAFEYARSLGDLELRRNAEARSFWYFIYPDLSEGKPGLFGAVTSRGEAQVMRVACLYALLDEVAEIEPAHLKAALAVWTYCEDSARYIFGSALGHPLAETLLSKLKAAPKGLTKTDLSAVVGRNRTAAEIDQALGVLAENGLATAELVETEGRPAHRWFATSPIARSTSPPNRTEPAFS
jgi:hypothetical protein